MKKEIVFARGGRKEFDLSTPKEHDALGGLLIE